MIRYRLYYDKDAEQKWLNEMCREGWAMVSFCAGLYTFVPCQPGEYIYQLDLLEGAGFRPSDPEGYTEFMEETSVEVVQRWARWVYLRKEAAEGPFEVYTDTESQVALYRRIRLMFLWALGLELLCSASIWLNIASGNGEAFFSVIAVLFVAIYIAFFRIIWLCTRRIQTLERRER